MFKLRLGEQAPGVFWPSASWDGAKMHQGADGGWFIFYYLNGVSRTEAMAHRKAQIQTAFIRDDTRTMLLTLVRFEGPDLIYELGYDPTGCPHEGKERRRELWGRSSVTSHVLIDTFSYKVKALRRANLPKHLWRIWLETWEKVLHEA